MTPENVERAIQFILELQARYEVSLEEAKQSFKETEQQIQKTQKQLEENAKEMRESSLRTDARIAALAEQTAAQNQVTSEQIRELKEACTDLLAHARNTDVRLNRLENPER